MDDLTLAAMSSNGLDKLAAAMAKAQTKIRTAKKGSVNPFYKSKYADLVEVSESCREALTENGLSILQPTEVIGGTTVLVTVLLHTSGQYISGRYPIHPVKNDPQGLGSAVTYARRYALASMVGVVSEGEDDDGNKASGAQTEQAHKVPEHKPVPQTETSKNVERADGVPSAIFVPQDVNTKSGEKNGKTWTKWGVKGPNGWYGTFDAEIAGIVSAAMEAGNEVELTYKSDGKYNTIIDAREVVKQ